MKIDEFIEKVNQVAYAEKYDDIIRIYSDKYSAEDWFFAINPQMQSVVNYYDWNCLDRLDPTTLFYILGLVQELKKTPIEKRFPEKKYRLRWIDDDLDGSPNYLDNPRCWGLDCNKSGVDTFTEKELQQLKINHPRFAPAIDAMKEPVEDVY